MWTKTKFYIGGVFLIPGLALLLFGVWIARGMPMVAAILEGLQMASSQQNYREAIAKFGKKDYIVISDDLETKEND